MEEPSDSHIEKKPRGRPPSIPKESQLNLFKENINRIIVDKKMVRSTNAVFYEMATALSSNKQTIYLAAKRYVESNKLIPKDDNDSDESDEEYTAYGYFDNFKISAEDICFEINTSGINLFDESIEQMLRKLEWSHTISEIIWEFSRLPCSWIFNRLKKVCNEFVFSARCKSLECSQLFAYTENNCSKIKIVIKAFNKEAVHLKKLSTKYVRKEKIDELLKLNSANVVRASLADQYMKEHEDFEPALLPNLGTLRTQKFRLNKKDYLDDNPTIALRKMKEMNKFFGSIMDVGLDPFFCMYATPLQNELLRVNTRYQSCVISFDASGAPVIPPHFSSYSIEHDKLKPVFIYTINLQLPSFSIPVFQLLSQRHKSNFLHYILSCWQDKCFGGKIPNEMVVDDSKALLLSAVETFTSCKTMVRYLNNCFDTLFNDSEAPDCYIRLDRSHFIKAIKNNEHLKNEDKRRKLLYQRLFGYLVTVEDVQIAEKIIREMFILLNNKYINDDYVANAKKSLKQISDFHLMEEIEVEDDNAVPSKPTFELFAEESKFKVWLHGISEDVFQNFVNHELNSSLPLNASEGDTLQDSVYYAPHLQKPFLDILIKLPLFSNIMMKAFKSTNKTATSSPSEVGFDFIKNKLFNHATRMRADTFVQKHIEYLLGNMKIYSTSKYTAPTDEEKIDESINANIDELKTKVYEENWRNKNLDIKPKSNRQKRCQNSLLDPLPPFKRALPILKNGERIIGTKTTVGSLVTHTCPFDSIFQVYVAFCADSQKFKQKIESDASMFSNMVQTAFTSIKDTLIQRSKLLLDLFKDEVIVYGKNVSALCCEMSINRMFSCLSSQFPILQSYQEIRKCDICSVQRSVGKTFIRTNLNALDLKNLQAAITLPTKTSKCSKCNNVNTLSFDKNEIVVFDVELLDKDGNHYPIKINDISKNICFDGQMYTFLAVVEYTKSHFIAHIRRNDNTIETYDDLKPSRTGKTPKYELNAVLLFFNKENGIVRSNQSDSGIDAGPSVQEDHRLSPEFKLQSSPLNVSDAGINSASSEQTVQEDHCVSREFKLQSSPLNVSDAGINSASSEQTVQEDHCVSREFKLQSSPLNVSDAGINSASSEQTVQEDHCVSREFKLQSSPLNVSDAGINSASSEQTVQEDHCVSRGKARRRRLPAHLNDFICNRKKKKIE